MALLQTKIYIEKEKVLKELNEGYLGAINDYVCSVEQNIKKAQNVDTEMGLEISLHLLEDALEDHGIELEIMGDFRTCL